MSARKLISALVLTLTVCISMPFAVGAGSPLPTTGAASVKGIVRFEGTVPKPKLVSMSTDPSCAKQHAAPVFAQEVMTDAKGDLQNVIVFVSEGLGDRTFDAPTQPVVVEQKGCMYQPHVLAVRANQPLHVVNDDPTSHNIHPTPANNPDYNQSQMTGSGDILHSFANQEVMIPIKCNIHNWMRAYVGVVSSPFFAVTGDDGTYTIKGLPPGTYTIEVWQEKYLTQDQQITVGAKESKTLDFTYKG